MIRFKNNRLFVGWRRSNWHDVWYEPIFSEGTDEDGTAAIGLYQSSKGPPVPREPTEGELHWLPQFSVVNCESVNKPEQKRLHMQTLRDAWEYCHEKNENKVKALEKKNNKPDSRRWQSWFVPAMKWKKDQLRRFSKKRQRAAAGDHQEALSDDSTSDSDSAYQSEPERIFAKPPFLNTKTTAKKRRSGPQNGAGQAKTPRRNHLPDHFPIVQEDIFDTSAPEFRGNRYDSTGWHGRLQSPGRGHDGSAPMGSNVEVENEFQRRDENGTEIWLNEARAMNGDMNEEEAIAEAQRASLAPEGRTLPFANFQD